MNLGILLALASAVAYGTSDFIGGVGARRCSPWLILLVGQIAGTIALLAAGLLRGGAPTAADFGWAVLAGVGSAAGGLFLYRGLARGRMGLVAPLSAVGAAALPVIAGVVLGERPGLLVWAGIAIALPGIWLVSRETGPGRPPRSWGALSDGALAGAGFGLLFVCLAQIGPDAGLLPLAANQATGALLAGIGVAAARPRGHRLRTAVGWGTAAGLTGAAGTVAFVLSSGTTSLAVAAVLTSLYPAVTVLLAAGVLRERLSAPQGAGIGICTLAIIALSLD
ncbi:DMT family transporter [Microbacterium sp. zg.Y1090]|uniref:DMT family transporter n=1 Tax=Microbacterium TaxID=33882 RepID=UPI00214ACBBE|nr:MULTISPECIES: DMT family transporter [unclassified Microbacterium]MCR2814025.1 DMT family transporter [Microbacterium sp. zg.Y1084]MCR2819299.1 DMT family transporter [Microbacterium sp. zg.Y1090]MDL5487216.1 EamA family transporter [Microbacterium sp. zg-Y1211]WIM28281.1 EamA family transporter [Microbacterium sp. zg-Y1090]